MPAKNHIELVVKTLAVLESLATSERGKALKEIAADVGLGKSTVFRILFTLKEAGYVEQYAANGSYRLTLKTGGLARRHSERLRLTDVARPHLIRLRDDLDESVALAERRAQAVVLIDVLETSHPLRLSFQIGDDCPIHATALGKAVAAFLSPEELASLLKNFALPQYTNRTKTKVLQLKAELARTKVKGYSINDEETVTGALLVGAPLFDRNRIVCGALSVNTPTARCSEKRRQQLIAAVVEAGQHISGDLADVGFLHPVTNSGS
ncbi:IclR family transcriptional regulator [Terriglobus saanensis]|uniref:Transcriptional regulator, IclR family n=1 Tax=Terriglobus saanensis (strain ATCC BAA-1853 / DSM 23119 / SP1PR4) TaxID=401053 RepID=E8V2N7_TERSS|nr:IclR family transcriptional regulator [Terriglobus saanensis]ADV83512.1 transcriptional regulator, IclR family [Terriglobus saanensis SP1PR4]